MNNSKQSLRQSIREQRKNLSSDFCFNSAVALAKQAAELPPLKSATHIAYYWPVANEMDPRPLVQLFNNELTYLPVLKPGTRELLFYRYQSGEGLQENLFKIPEPVNQSQLIAAADLDLVIVPLLGFDLAGNRLGTGGGYYDYTFSFLNKIYGRRPILLGIGYEFQKISNLTTEPWDIKLNLVATEAEIYHF